MCKSKPNSKRQSNFDNKQRKEVTRKQQRVYKETQRRCIEMINMGMDLSGRLIDVKL